MSRSPAKSQGAKSVKGVDRPVEDLRWSVSAGTLVTAVSVFLGAVGVVVGAYITLSARITVLEAWREEHVRYHRNEVGSDPVVRLTDGGLSHDAEPRCVGIGASECLSEARAIRANVGIEEALPVYQEACHLGNSLACFEVGSRYIERGHDDDSVHEAAIHYKFGCNSQSDSGVGESCLSLAVLLLRFHQTADVVGTYGSAREILDRQCQRPSHSGRSCLVAAHLAELGFGGVPQSRGNALTYARMGCERGLGWSCAYAADLDIDANRNSWMERACHAGDAASCKTDADAGSHPVVARRLGLRGVFYLGQGGLDDVIRPL